jgi:hypothetical protein
VKPSIGTLRVTNPVRQSRASSRKRAAMREWHACINGRTLYGPFGRGSWSQHASSGWAVDH